MCGPGGRLRVVSEPKPPGLFYARTGPHRPAQARTPTRERVATCKKLPKEGDPEKLTVTLEELLKGRDRNDPQ